MKDEKELFGNKIEPGAGLWEKIFPDTSVYRTGGELDAIGPEGPEGPEYPDALTGTEMPTGPADDSDL